MNTSKFIPKGPLLIINRYIIQEICKTFAIITAILLLIAVSNRLAVLLARSVDSQFPLPAILQAVCLIIPELLTAVIPIAFFGALIVTQSRMYADSEMVVLLSSGFTTKNLVRLNANIAIGVTLILLCCSLLINPTLNHLRNDIAQEQYNSSLHLLITPGKFQNLLGGKVILYAKSVSQEGNINNIFLVIKGKKSPLPDSIVTARYATLKDGILTLKNGHRYEGVPGKRNYKIVSFEEYTKPLILNNSKPFEKPEKLTSELLFSDNLQDKVELQMRIAMPFTTIILAMLAISLSKIKPRSGKFSNFVPAILNFLIYYSALIFAHKLMLQARLSLYSLWAIHIIFLLYSLYKMRRVPL